MELNLDKKSLWIDADYLTSEEYTSIIIDDDVAYQASNSSEGDDDINYESKVLNKSINDRFKKEKNLTDKMVIDFIAEAAGVRVLIVEEPTQYTIEMIRGVAVRSFDNRLVVQLICHHCGETTIYKLEEIYP